MNYPSSNWYLTAGTNDYRLGLMDGWLSVLREHYGLSLLQLPAGFLVGGGEWDLARVRSAVLDLAEKHGTSALVGFDHAVPECPEGLEDDWPHQHGLLAHPEGTVDITEKQWFVCSDGGCTTELVPAQERTWTWQGIPIAVAVCHDLAGLVHGAPRADAPAIPSPIRLLLNPRHVNTTGENPVGWGRLAVTLRRVAADFECAVASSMLYRALSAGSAADRFAYQYEPALGEAQHWVAVQQPYLWDGEEVIAWFQVLELAVNGGSGLP